MSHDLKSDKRNLSHLLNEDAPVGTVHNWKLSENVNIGEGIIVKIIVSGLSII